MSQRLRSEIEKDVRLYYGSEVATKALQLETLLDLRDTANEILAEMKRVEITGDDRPIDFPGMNEELVKKMWKES